MGREHADVFRLCVPSRQRHGRVAGYRGTGDGERGCGTETSGDGGGEEEGCGLWCCVEEAEEGHYICFCQFPSLSTITGGVSTYFSNNLPQTPQHQD